MEYKKNTLGHVVRFISEKYKTRSALIFGEQIVSYEKLYRQTRLLAANLQKLGIKQNDRVAVLLPNCIEYLYIYFALFTIGVWAVPLSTRYEKQELANILVNAGCKAIIYQNKIGIFDYNQIFSEIMTQLDTIKHFICTGQGPENFASVNLNDLLTCDNGEIPELDMNSVQEDDIALLAYTSGTTGTPKGVMIPHKNLVLTSYHAANLWDIRDEVAFSVAPLYAAQGFLAVLIDLVAGITMKWNINFNPNDILSHLVKEEVTVFHTQPTMWTLLLSLPFIQHIEFKHLTKAVVSGSLCSYELAKRIQNTVRCKLLNAYGLIEATGVVTLTHPDDPDEIRLNSVGRPIPGVQIKIVDDNRNEVQKGEIGELAIKGYLMKGYYKNEEKTREVIDEDGWLYSGDQAMYCDDRINIRIVGRCKDMVIRGGFNVYPIDIEECLLQFDKVDDVSVVGKEDPILGEALVAFVIPKADAVVKQGQIKQFCRGKIANYKIPDEVLFVSQFPILLSGKVQKNILREWAVQGIPEENQLLFSEDFDFTTVS